jgi:hypothetical protein
MKYDLILEQAKKTWIDTYWSHQTYDGYILYYTILDIQWKTGFEAVPEKILIQPLYYSGTSTISGLNWVKYKHLLKNTRITEQEVKLRMMK